VTLALKPGSSSITPLMIAFFPLLICSELTAAPVHPERARVAEKTIQRMLVKRVGPNRPADATHVRGVVALKANIDKEGNVENLDVISGHPMLVPAAIEAVKQWKYKPFVINGWPVEVETTIHVSF
jgi:protein TonB